jgi:hypothetical protein
VSDQVKNRLQLASISSASRRSKTSQRWCGRAGWSLEWVQRLLADGTQAQDIDLQIIRHWAVMISHFFLGQLLEAREQGNRSSRYTTRSALVA